MKIEQIDKNFVVETKIEREGLTFFDIEEEPFRIYGLIREDGHFCRLPEAVAKATNDGVARLCRHNAGGRVRFVTDSPYIAISAEMNGVGKMPHFALTGSIGFDLYAESRYDGTFTPPFGVDAHYENIIDVKQSGEHVYTINFPLYSGVKKLYVGLKAGCVLKAAPDYTVEKPVVYYGSSITQGGCASRPGNAYQAIITSQLDCNHINLGFSGSARGEDAIADYIAGLEMSAFVYDYDHNAPSIEHLANTHERMFLRIREKNPELPVMMLSRPKYHLSSGERDRMAIIRRTWENAVARGDKNVYFIPGPELILDLVRETATVDNCHPNDSGFVSMAYVVGNKLREILGL